MFSSCKWFFFSYNSEVVKLLLRYLLVIWYFMTKYWIFTYTFQLNHHSDSGGKYFLFHFIGGEVKDRRGKAVHLYICHGFPVIVSYCLTIYWASCAKSFQWYPLCVTPWTVACQAPLTMGFSRRAYWSGLPFPPPGDLPWTRVSCLGRRFLPTTATWEALV